MKRIFTALWPSPRTQHSIERACADWAWPDGCRKYPARDLHLTLQFIGACADEKIAQFRDELSVPVEPFTIALDTPRRWPKGLVVLCPAEIPPELTRLHEALAASLRRCGVAFDDRAFRPHVTLARNCSSIALPSSCEPIEWSAHQYVLVESTGDPRRRYVSLQSYGQRQKPPH